MRPEMASTFDAPRVVSNVLAARQLPHYRYDRAQLIIAAGKRGNGKTTLIQEYIESREPRLFMIDPHNDFPWIEESETVMDALRDMQAYPDACWRRVVPEFSAFSEDDDITEYGQEVFRLVNRYLRCALVVYNEITLWSNPLASKPLKNQIRQGRRLGLKHFIDTQRFAESPDIMRSEGTHLVVFHTTRFLDRKVLALETSKQVAEMARTLDVGECIPIDL